MKRNGKQEKTAERNSLWAHERGDYTTMNEEKKLNMPQSLLLLLLIIGSVAVCIRLKTGGPMIGLFLSWIIIYLFCKVLKINYDQIVGGAYDAIRVVVPNTFAC